MKLTATKRVVALIAIIICMAELFFMLVLEHSVLLHNIDRRFIAPLNVVFLTGVATPLIYFFVINPFIIARDEALAQVSHLAHVDPLTQLANRRLLLSHLGKAAADIARYKTYGALLLLDLDGFKPVNDTHGHDAGDALLVELAKRLQSITRSGDIVCRLGGDEFVVLISHLGIDERIAHDKALLVAKKLINLVDKPFDFNGKVSRVSASVGIRLLDFAELDTETVIGEADSAMYRAKQAGKGCAVFFEK